MSLRIPCAVAEHSLTAGQRAEWYQALAEALAEPPAWLAEAGPAWPLYAPALALAEAGLTDTATAAALAALPAEPLAERQARYAALFGGPGRPKLWLYESAFLSGRPFGPEATAVARLYRAAGLESTAAELPDHATLELAFLAELAGAGWDEWERRFLADHAGRWLPALGQALARSGDVVYAVIGRLLTDVITAAAEPQRAVRRGPQRPWLAAPEACTLCGFCAQVCPTRALSMQEDAQTTWLALNAEACPGCGKCARVCPEKILRLAAGAEAAPVLRRSPRMTCPGCGQPAVSEAEFERVAALIGRPAWLAYCPACRLHQVPSSRAACLEA